MNRIQKYLLLTGTILSTNLFCQVDTLMYHGTPLRLIDTYDVGLSIFNSGSTIYHVNSTRVNEATFYKFYVGFNEQNRLSKLAHYKENSSTDWSNLYPRELCSVLDGITQYYDSTGQVAFEEHWENGVFIRQIPEQPKAELWDISIALDSIELANNAIITLSDLKSLRFIPKFKNSNENVDLEIEIKVYSMDRTKFLWSITVKQNGSYMRSMLFRIIQV